MLWGSSWMRRGARPLAVDLGTANTVVFRRGDGIVVFEPSVVAIDELAGRVAAVGADARRMIGRTPAHIRATRPLRHGVITDFETTEAMLRHFIRQGAERSLRKPDVIVCIPGGVTQVERTAVEEATLGAGAAHAFLIEEPLAAAIGAGLPVGEPVGSLVVDIGGGALLPGLDHLLEQQTRLGVSVDTEPLTTVARGAGRALEETHRLRHTRGRRRTGARFTT
jgi:MreB/Mrl family cell shape determining protein